MSTTATSRRRALVIIQSQVSIHGPISALSMPSYVICEMSRLQHIIMAKEWLHHVVATGQLATKYLPVYLGPCGDIWDNTRVPKFKFSHQLVVISVFFSLRKYRLHVKASLGSLLRPCHLHRKQRLFGFATHHRHWTSRPFSLNHAQRSLTTLLLRVSLAHTLAKISDDAGAFILRSLVSASQRRRQVPPAAGVHRGK